MQSHSAVSEVCGIEFYVNYIIVTCRGLGYHKMIIDPTLQLFQELLLIDCDLNERREYIYILAYTCHSFVFDTNILCWARKFVQSKRKSWTIYCIHILLAHFIWKYATQGLNCHLQKEMACLLQGKENLSRFDFFGVFFVCFLM